ncbi:MAG TPA: hypothetical protein VLN26_06365 [Gaiellaceae bacterium]|nr:hypothetical protein [Gaiellaceae bacterium]
MRLELGAHMRCSDDVDAGRLDDVVVDPVRRCVTHVVVRAGHGPGPSRLVPFALVSETPGDGHLALRCTSEELEHLEATQNFAVVPLGEHPAAGESWDVGVEDDVPLASYDTGGMGDYVGVFDSTVGVTYDRIPKGTVELRSSSAVECADGRCAGHLSALDVDGDALTHVVFPRGHLWRRRDVQVPIDHVAELATDAVVVTVSSKAVAADS